MVPTALRPLYIEELRRLTAELNRTAQRIESVLASLRDGDEPRDRSETGTAIPARLLCPSNVVPLFPQVVLHRDQLSDGETKHALSKGAPTVVHLGDR